MTSSGREDAAHGAVPRRVKVQLVVAVGWLLLAGAWWLVDDATWQPPVFTVISVVYATVAVATLRYHRRRREADAPSSGTP